MSRPGTRAKDWPGLLPPRLLVVGENPSLQWSEGVREYAMFADYYFRERPFEPGEGSRYAEARSLFDMVSGLTGGACRSAEVYVTDLCPDRLERPPKGKHVLLPADRAVEGVKRLHGILKEHPGIEWVFALSLQVNYWLWKEGFFADADAVFLHGAQPRRTGMEHRPPYYRPVDPGVFNGVCGRVYDVSGFDRVRGVPLPPLRVCSPDGTDSFYGGEAYAGLRALFARQGRD